jgi:transcriptional regulator with XRE-family HTH domain
MSQPTLRERLRQELVRRIQKNPRYSLRSFAQALGVNSGTLSQILAGKRGVSAKQMKTMLPELGLAPEELAALREGEGRQDPAVSFHRLTLEMFEVIADWYHYAILELIKTRGFRSEPAWVARRLGLSVFEVQAAVQRMENLGLLKIARDGRWIDASGDVTTVGNDFTATAFRQLQRQVLERALRALDEVPYERREQTSLTLAVDARQIPEIKARIHRFNEELGGLVESRRTRDEVYHFGMSLYPVSVSLPKGSTNDI